MSELTISSPWRLKRLSVGNHGHTLNHRQIFSPTGEHVFFDSRNNDVDIIVTDRIGRMDLRSGEVEWLYRVPRPTAFGPGVGAVACEPQHHRLMFIHGLRNCDSRRPYSATRRFGARLDLQSSGHTVEHAEARCLMRSPPWGVLRGGTHAHSWSHDGTAISFTYNDAWMEEQHRHAMGPADVRTVGVMVCTSGITVPEPSNEQFSGRYWSMVVAAVKTTPAPGSDEIESAREECFMGQYCNRLAMIGRIRGTNGDPIDEVYIARWPERWDPPTGTAETDSVGRLIPPDDVQLERITRTEHRKYPGISGPRSWLISSPNGRILYAPMRDDHGIVQVVAINVASGGLEPLTELNSSLDSPLALNAEGNQLSLMSNGRVGVLDLEKGRFVWSQDLRERLEIPWGAFHFLQDNRGLLFHAYDKNDDARWLHIWTLTLH